MSWATDLVHQNLSATGSYNSSSALAKEYASLEEDGGSRVDDEAGWREIKRDSPPKNAAEYESLVKEYAAQGFDVKAIDMDGDDFTHSNIAIKPKGASSGGEKGEVEVSPRLATARARAAQYEEDRVTGQAAKDLYDAANNPAEGFLERYKLKLGEQLENGNYRRPEYNATNSSKVASGENDVSVNTSQYARTGKDNRKGY
jgi:hypothetical protein